MKNTIKKGKVSFLIIKKGNKYLGICREFGFVEEAKSADDVQKKLIKGAILLLETVKKNPKLEPSLNTAPPMKYLVLFYVAPLFNAFKFILNMFKGDIRLIERDIPSLSLANSNG